MKRKQGTQAKDSRGGKTPEEIFDRQFLSGTYTMIFIVVLFLIVGVECYVGLMSREIAVVVAATIGSFTAYLLAAPLFWETDENNNRLIRKIRRAVYFPISIRAFVFSKIKLMSMYGGFLWLVSLAIQTVFSPLFGFGNLWLYQGVLLAAFFGNMMICILIGTV